MKKHSNKRYGIEKHKTFSGMKYQVVDLGDEIEIPNFNLPKVDSGKKYTVTVHDKNGESSHIMLPIMEYVTKKEYPVVELETGVASYDTLKDAKDTKRSLETSGASI